MHYVYILQSQKTGRYYIGCTEDPGKRLARHNQGSTRSTKYARPWRIIHLEELPSKNAALLREKQIKSYKSGRAFKALIQSYVMEEWPSG